MRMVSECPTSLLYGRPPTPGSRMREAGVEYVLAMRAIEVRNLDAAGGGGRPRPDAALPGGRVRRGGIYGGDLGFDVRVRTVRRPRDPV